MLLACLLVLQDGVEIDILERMEDIAGDLAVRLGKPCDELLDLEALGVRRAVRVAGRARLGELAGALDEVEAIVIAPALDIRLVDVVERADELHAGAARALDLRHHRADGAGVEHAHEIRLNHIVEVMAERDLIAAELAGLAVEVAAAHLGTEVARRLLHMEDRLEDVRREERQRHMEELRILLDDAAVHLVVAGIHAEKDELERELVVALELLEELRHEHRVLAARDADGDLVAGAHEVEFADGFDELRGNLMLELLAQRALNALEALFILGRLSRLALQLPLQPERIAALQRNGGISLLPEILCEAQADFSPHADADDELVLGQIVSALLQFQRVEVLRPRQRAALKGHFIADVDELDLILRQRGQFFHSDFLFRLPSINKSGHIHTFFLFVSRLHNPVPYLSLYHNGPPNSQAKTCLTRRHGRPMHTQPA